VKTSSLHVANEINKPPCFFAEVCLKWAEMEKAGRSVCHDCAVHLRGVEYPLRGPSLQPIYLTGRTAAEALDMLDLAQDAREQP